MSHTCYVCSRRLRSDNRYGYCDPCRKRFACDVCGKPHQGGTATCAECQAGLRMFHWAMARFWPEKADVPDAGRETRMERYKELAKAKLPLFDKGGTT